MATASSSRPAVTVSGGRWEFQLVGGGVLVLADPPEAGWRLVRQADADVRPKVKPGGPR